VHLLKIMTYYVPESHTVTLSRQVTIPHRVALPQVKLPQIEVSCAALAKRTISNRKAVILEMTQVAWQELSFGHVRSALDSLSIVWSLLFGQRHKGLM
jgi:hypothetical protein